MINKQYLQFNVLTKPKKDLFKVVQANAKFKTLNDVLRTKVGINNFYNFSIAIESSIVMRDIILNSQFVSGWARSSQVLNKTDSKFSGYRFLTRDKEETNKWIRIMESLEMQGHTMDNMRSLIYLDSITNYAISIDILHLLYITIVLDSIYNNLDETHDDLKDEIGFFLYKFNDLLYHEYDIDYAEYENMLSDAICDFPVISAERQISVSNITDEYMYGISATYSVIGQIWRHRTLVKQYAAQTYTELVEKSKTATANYNYDMIGMHKDIADGIVAFTADAKSIYDLCQGTIVPFVFSGTVGAIRKALSQRTCYINDSPQFKDAFDAFKKNHPDMHLIPPCKLNTTETNSCYVGYVNESRRRGEEKTQICCPIYCKAKGYDVDFAKSAASQKTKWYVENLEYWGNVVKC